RGAGPGFHARGGARLGRCAGRLPGSQSRAARAVPGALLTPLSANQAHEGVLMRYLVTGSEGPGFASPEETVGVLERIVIPSFDVLTALESKRKIVAGGLPLGDRAFVFIVDAKSNEE